MPRGTFCISIDVEGAWGTWDRPSAEEHRRCAEMEERSVRELVSRLDRAEIPATWAIVGRLLERDDRAVASTSFGEGIWYAPGLIEVIRRTRTPQDIGSHGYAHRYFGRLSRDEARLEIARARSVHDRHGLPFKAFVFPRNEIGHLDELRAAGVEVFRGGDRGWHAWVRNRVGRTAGRIANLADKVFPLRPAVVHTVDHGGLVELPSSMLFLGRSGLRRAVHPHITVIKARRGLEAARRSGGTFHLWFHPSNFYDDGVRQLEALSSVLATATAMRSRGEIDIRPMSDHACRRASASAC